MGAALGAIGVLGFFVCLVWLVIRLVTRKSKKPVKIGMIVCVALFFIGFLISPHDERTGNPDESAQRTNAADASSSPDASDTQDLIRAAIKVSASGEPGKPIFTVTTNLPDETKLVLTLKNEDGFTAQTDVVVEEGEATSEAFSNNGTPLSGKYTLTVSMSLPSLQSEKVRSVIGENGENIVGNFLQVDRITGAHWIQANIKFDFKGDAENPGAPPPEAEQNPEPEPDPPPADIPADAQTEPEPKPSQTPSNPNRPPSGGGGGNADNFNTYDNSAQQDTEDKWVLNTSSKKIHYPSCKEVKKIAPQNYSTSNLSESELKEQGYTTCGVCH